MAVLIAVIVLKYMQEKIHRAKNARNRGIYILQIYLPGRFGRYVAVLKGAIALLVLNRSKQHRC